jgi:hypothetical protein
MAESKGTKASTVPAMSIVATGASTVCPFKMPGPAHIKGLQRGGVTACTSATVRRDQTTRERPDLRSLYLIVIVLACVLRPRTEVGTSLREPVILSHFFVYCPGGCDIGILSQFSRFKRESRYILHASSTSTLIAQNELSENEHRTRERRPPTVSICRHRRGPLTFHRDPMQCRRWCCWFHLALQPGPTPIGTVYPGSQSLQHSCIWFECQ